MVAPGDTASWVLPEFHRFARHPRIMQVHRDLDKLPRFRKAVVTIGTFDGVHLGHQHIIRELCQVASDIGGESVIITFDPHPREVLSAQPDSIHLLNCPEEKMELLARQGVDHLVMVPFTREFSLMPAEEYIADFLVRRFQLHTIIIGYDHRFGYQRKGDYTLLESRQQTYGYHVREIPKQLVDELTVSSTKIRQKLLEGDAVTSRHLLGYCYFMTGTVIHGEKRGRLLGFPTINLSIADPRKLIPAHGVYSVLVHIPKTNLQARFPDQDGMEVLQGVLNIGKHPTFSDQGLHIEAHLFHTNRDLYGCMARIHLVSFQRRDQKFSSAEELVQQMHKDKAQALLDLDAFCQQEDDQHYLING